MLANFDVTPSVLFMVLLACNKLQPSKTQASQVDCSNFPCYNGGTCTPGPLDMCICPSFTVQPFCTISCQSSQNINDPCVNGVCVGDVCNCDTNFAGPTCESAIAAYLSPLGITVTEGHVGQKEVTVQVCRQPSSEEVTLQVFTNAGLGANPALPDVDYVNINPRQDVTISAGRTCAPVNVFIISDLTQDTMSKDFFLVLYDPQPSSSMVHIVFGQSFTIITITDDDPVDCNDFPCFYGGTCVRGPPDMCSCPPETFPPFCTISCQDSRHSCVNGVCNGDVCNCPPDFTGPRCESAIAAYLSPSAITVTEGHVGQKAVTLQVCRQPSSEEVTLQAYTNHGLALPDVDFVAFPFNARQDVTISAGQTCTPVNVFIISDLTQETMSKALSLVLYDPQPSSMVHFVPGNGFTTITIIDDDSDIEPPTIDNCPDDITVTAPAGAAATTVSWTPPTATDLSGAVTLTSSQNPGDSFTIGSTQVTYTANDGANNFASCGFTVTVVEREPPSLPVYLVALVIPVLIFIILLVVIIKRIRRKPATESKPEDVKDVDFVNAGVTDDHEDYIALDERSRNTPAQKYQDLTEKEAPTQESRYERTIYETADATPKAMTRQGLKRQTDYQYEDATSG